MEKNRGFIKTILIIVIALAFLKYFFDWSIFDLAESERGRATLAYIKDVIASIWSYFRSL